MERAAERHRQTTVFESDHDASLSATYLDLQEVAWVDFREFDAVHLHTYECPKRGVPAWFRNATDANATAGARLRQIPCPGMLDDATRNNDWTED